MKITSPRIPYCFRTRVIMNESFIERDCPLCKSKKYKLLLHIDPAHFIKTNLSLNTSVIKECGILNLPHIPLVKCKKCKFAYTKYCLNNRWLSVVYNEIISAEKSKNKIFQHSKRLLNLNIWNQLYSYVLKRDPSSFDTIHLLEHGCGWGDFLNVASSHGVDCTGIETDKRKLDFCHQNGLNVYSTFDKINSGHRFDIFLANQVFEHLSEPVESLLAIKPLLSTNFIGYISVPCYSDEKLQQSIKNIAHGQLSDKNLNSWEHLNYFSPQLLWKFINNCGFEIFNPTTDQTIPKRKMVNTSCYFRFNSESKSTDFNLHFPMLFYQFYQKLTSQKNRFVFKYYFFY